jgi:ligand-binding sensor domain-containing protein/two-component sensor histidine kinase
MSNTRDNHFLVLSGSRVWLYFVLLWSVMVGVRAEQLPVRVYTTADGLGSSAITHIMRDSRGVLWFCTRDGLSRFDGVRFTTYSIGQNPSYPTINHILETRGSVYLIATNGGGIYRFDPNAVSSPVSPTSDDTDNRVTLNAEKVSDINFPLLFEDRAGRLWAGGGGLYQLEETDNRLSFRQIEMGLPVKPGENFVISGFNEARDGSLWLRSGESATRRLPDGRTIQYILPQTSGDDFVTALEEDREGRIWIGHVRGFYVLNPEPLHSLSGLGQYTARPLPAPKNNVNNLASDNFSRLPEGESAHYANSDGLSDNPVTGLLKASDGRMWVADNRGLTVFDGERLQNFADTHGIIEKSGGVLAEDIEGNLWVGNQSGGARKLLTNGMTTFDKSDGLGELRIHSIYENQNGELYVVNGNFLISRFDEKDFDTVRPNLPADARFTWTSNVGFPDSRADWWMPTNLGLYRFSGIGQFEELARRQPVVYSTSNGLKSDDTYRVFEDTSGDIWISTRSGHTVRNGLTRWQRSTNTFHIFTEAEGLPPFIAASAFAQDKAGNLWMGFYEGGMARYADGHFTIFTTADGVPASFITGLYLDRANHLWISSAMGGLSRIDDPTAPQPKFETYTTADGLSSNNVRCVVEDLAGNIYVGTVRGVDRLNPANGNIRHYGLSEGLADDFVNVAYRDRKGALWFGTPRGLSRLQPEPERVRSVPPILISGLRVAGVKQPVSELGQSEIHALELDYTQNNLQVDFFSLNFALGENIRYQYKLEGADANWSEPTTQHAVNYPNIPPGDYRFLVRAVNSDGIASAAPAFVPFTILRPVWQRGWFLALAILLSGAAIYGFYRYRLTKLLEIERTRTRIATDLHDDIGASLSRIAMLSEVVKRQNGAANQASVKRLTQIADNARDLVDSMSDIVWSIDPRRDSLSSVLARARSFAADTLGERGVKWSLEAAPELGEIYLSSEQRRGLYLIFKEAVINIARHAECQNARLKISLNHQNLIAEIADDGGGLPKQSNGNSRGGHGLENMRKRAAEIGGQLEINSSENGTKLILTLPRTKTKSISMLFRRRRNKVE